MFLSPSAARADSTPNDREDWVLSIIPMIYEGLKARLNNIDVPYVIYGDDAGGIFVQVGVLPPFVMPISSRDPRTPHDRLKTVVPHHAYITVCTHAAAT
jgi:hypothetical protein